MLHCVYVTIRELVELCRHRRREMKATFRLKCDCADMRVEDLIIRQLTPHQIWHVQNQIREAIGYGAIKMNIDTDLQWAFWDGILGYYKKNEGYLQGQLGNPEGENKPNKKYYDPRVWLRKAEETLVKRLELAFPDLNCLNRNA